MNIDEIKDILQKHKPELKDKYKVKTIGIFGSYIKDKQNKRSDIDILVDFESPIDFFIFLELEEMLSQLIGIKVDLVMKKTLKPGIGKFILQETIYV